MSGWNTWSLGSPQQKRGDECARGAHPHL
jgi:hypothetical protein